MITFFQRSASSWKYETVAGTVNMLVSDRYTDIGEGATYQSTFLDVEPWREAS